jgi:hypothetical protein
MAGLLCSVRFAAIAYSAATTKTALILTAPTNQRLLVVQFGMTTDLSSPTAVPGVLTIYKATTAGAFTSVTPVRLSAGSETPQATAGANASSEPTEGDIIRQVYLDRDFWEARAIDLRLPVPGGTRLAFKIYTPSGINVLPWIEYEE